MTTKLIKTFEAMFADLKQADLRVMNHLYQHDVAFRDPVQSLTGLVELKAYLNRSRSNLSHCTFTFDGRAQEGDRVFFQWRMHFSHPRIAAGREQTLRGCTTITIDGKITYHEDFYDLGAMLYEHVPLLGWATRRVKNAMVED